MGKMKAVVFKKHGTTSELEETYVPVPELGKRDVLVKVKACALNHLDLWVLGGMPGIKISMPHILGCDIAGEVVEKGKKAHGIPLQKPVIVAPGISCGKCDYCKSGWDSLCAKYEIVGFQNNGGYAEYVKIPARNIIPVTGKLGMESWAAVPLVFLTALCRLLDVPVMATMKNQLKCYYTSTDSGVDEFFQVLHMFYEGTYIRRKTLRVSYAATVSEAVHNSSGKHVAVTPEYALIKHSILADINQGRHASFHPVSLTIALSERGLLLDAPLRGQIIADKFWVVSRDTWEEMIVRTPMTLLPVTPAQPIRPLSINIA